MAHAWRGVIEEFRDRLPFDDDVEVVTLGEGGTPLVPARHLSELTGCEVWLKCEGVNPTGSFKDRGMTAAITQARAAGARTVICASTGNTSASAAAYATAAGLGCAVLVPEGKIALGKLSQAIAHGATLLQVDGNFDDCLTLARKLAEAYPVELVNSVNPLRIQGQKTAAFEVVDALGDAPDIHCLPVGNAGNITAYWLGYQEYAVGSDQPGPGHAHTGDVGVPGGRGRAHRARPSGRPAGHDRHRDPDRQPGVVAAGRRRPGRERRSDRGRHRRADPGRPPDPLGPRGGVRRTGLGRQRGRAARDARRRPPGGRAAGGLHGDRPRPEGPGVGGQGAGRRRGPSRSGCRSTR